MSQEEHMESFDDEEDTFLNPEDIMEVIEVDEKTDFDDVAERLMDVLDCNVNEDDSVNVNGEDYEMDNIGDDEELEEEENNEPGDRIAPLRLFTKHTNSVFCCCFSSCGKYAATGDEDETAYLWSIETGDVLLCFPFEDSVIFVKFIEDDKKLIMADMLGNIQLCSVSDKKVVKKRTESDILCSVFVNNVLFCGTKGNVIKMWNTKDATLESLPEVVGSPVCGIAVTSDGAYAVCGFESGEVVCFHINSMSRLTLDKRSNHLADLTSIQIHSEGRLFVTGGVDGAVKLNTMPHSNNNMTGKLVKTFSPPSDDTIECIGFSVSHPNLLVVGKKSGDVSVYDVVTQRLRHSLSLPGVSSVAISPVSPLAYFSCLDGKVRVVNVLSGKQTHRLIGHSRHILQSVATDRSGQIILSTSDDGTCALHAIEQ